MNSNPHNTLPSQSVPPDPVSRSAEETLRLIASLPAPAGLEDRVRAALRAAPNRGRAGGEERWQARKAGVAGVARRGRVLAWPAALRHESNWMRTAAAAAIVFVVVGGGWGVYTRVEQNQPAKVIVMPSRMPVPAGFSGAGAVRTPQTLPGPAVTQKPLKAKSAQPKAARKPVTTRKPTAAPTGQPASSAKPAMQPGPSR